MAGTFATLISNNLNIGMQFLASITIIIAIPIMIANFFQDKCSRPSPFAYPTCL
jgi:hypothetical protein